MSNAALTPNRETAELHLRLLAPGTERFTFQTFTDCAASKAKGVRDPLARILHGSLAENLTGLVRLSAAGAGVYATVNETDLQGRSAAHIVRVRANFVDLDGAPLSNLKRMALRPHFVVQSSANRYHAYWLVEGAKLESFKPTQQRLANLLDGDIKVCDLPRVMRLGVFCIKRTQRDHFSSRYVLLKQLHRRLTAMMNFRLPLPRPEAFNQSRQVEATLQTALHHRLAMGHRTWAKDTQMGNARLSLHGVRDGALGLGICRKSKRWRHALNGTGTTLHRLQMKRSDRRSPALRNRKRNGGKLIQIQLLVIRTNKLRAAAQAGKPTMGTKGHRRRTTFSSMNWRL
jgi:RepB DNA-primase from phage plasmid